MALRVMTFNVEYRTRAELLIAALRSHTELGRADVLMLQEIIDDARAASLAAALGMEHVYAHGLAILSRGPLREVEVIELPDTPVPFNRSRRLALVAQIDSEAGPVRVTSVHLATRINIATRIRQLAPAVASTHPLQIIGGDMNTLPFHFAGGAVPVFLANQAARLDDHVRALGFATPGSGAGATHRHLPRARLDAVFTRGFAPAVARVARDVRLSDHYPVWVDLELSPPAPPAGSSGWRK